MKLIIENIGMIKSANIKLDGLTVIAGENDSGKSTVGKLIFSVVKALNHYKKYVEEEKKREVMYSINSIFSKLRKTRRTVKDINYLRKLFDFRDKIIHNTFSHKDFKNVKIIIQQLKKSGFVKNLKNDELNLIKNMLKEIEKYLQFDEDEKEKIRYALHKVFLSEFQKDLIRKGSKKSKVNLLDGNLEILSLSVEKNNGSENLLIEGLDEGNLMFSDATYVATPFVLDFNNLIEKSIFFFDNTNLELHLLGRSKVSLHFKDLIDKLTESTYLLDFNNYENIIKKMPIVIKDHIIFDQENREFVLLKRIKGKELVFNINNVASGVKSFGIIELLMKNGFLKENSFLIIDEPEVHLHPKWQIQYAELIVFLVKELGVSVLINSHSPYMIEAFQKISEHKGIKEKTNFYLAQNGVIKKHKNSNLETLSVIFELLSEPFKKFDELDEI